MSSLRKIGIFCLGALALASSPCVAQEAKLVPQTKAEASYSFAPVVKKAAPAVVNIYTKQRVTVRENISPFMNDPFFKQFFGNQMPQGFTFGGRAREQVVSSLGSGVIVKPDGVIVTSHHVIKDAQEITVVLASKEEFPAKVVLRDVQSDLAVLKIDATVPLPFIEMSDSDTAEVGDLVLAIGNPFGVGQTVTNGIISALARAATGVSDYQFFIQTDAAINPGNSGGALVNMEGKLVGINTAIYSRSGGSLGIGFAIPANMVRSLLEAKVQGGRIIHPWIGISVQPMTREIADSLGLKSTGALQGVIIRGLHTDSPAARGGLKVGDVILAVGGIDIFTAHDLQYRLALAKIGESTSFRVLRDGKTLDYDVKLIEPPENPKRDVRVIKGRNPLSGVTVANLSPAVAVELGMDETGGGVVIAAVGQSELGVNIGLSRGDVILEVNGKKIDSTSQLADIMKSGAKKWQIAYRRGATVMTITVNM